MSYTVVPICLSGNNIGIGKNSTNLVPLELNYALTDKIKIKNQSLVFNDGFRLYTNKVLENLKDVSFTKNTGYYLTNLNTWNDFIYDGYNLNVNNLNNDTKILFDRLNNTGFFYAYFRDVTGPNPYNTLYINSDLNIAVSETEKTLIKVVKTTNNKVKLFLYETEITQYRQNNKTTREYLLAVDISTYDHAIKLISPSQDLTNYIYEFNITIEQDLARISYDVSTYKNLNDFELSRVQGEILNQGSVTTRYIGIHNNILKTNHIYRSITGEFANTNKYKDTLNIFKSSFFALVNSGYNPLTLGIADSKQNTWVGYYNEIYDKQNNQNVKPNPALTVNRVPINYLLTTTFKVQTSSKQKLDVNVVPLKTAYTPEQETIKTKTVYIDGVPVIEASENLQPIQRNYTKLFTNNNEVENYSNIHLGFSASTKEFTFKADQNTFFHYPLQADIIPIAQANLIESGALPGATPYLSDRIFMKNAAYGDKSVWGHVTPPPGCLDGQFLCAWLSGSDASSLSGLENSVWMDRWYDAASVTEISALQASITQINSDLSRATIVDTPSKMILNPGGWYYYYHAGNKDISSFIQSFNIGNTGCRLDVQGDPGGFQDQSNYQHIVDIVNRKNNTIIVSNPDENLEDNFVLNLDNTNYATIQYKESLDISKDLTFSTWLYTDTWDKNPGYHIIDNGFRGGWNIHLGTGFYNPTVSIAESNYGHALNFSTELQPYVDNVLLSGGKLNSDNIIVTNDLFTFTFDKNSKTLNKFDYNGDMIDLIDLSTYTTEISNSKLELGPNNILHLHFNNILLKTDTSFISTSSETLNYSNFVIDLNGKVVGGDFIDAAVDNQNNIWYISACPVEFFTDYNQPDLNEPFFKPSANADFLNRSLTDALTSNGDLNFVFYCNSDSNTVNPLICSQPISVVDLNNNGITFATFFPNNAENGILAKFFQPTRLDIDQDNYLYLTNDTTELSKFIIDKNNQLAGFIFRKSLINNKTTTGLSLSGVNDYIQTNIIDQANNAHRDDPQFKYLEIKTTKTLWKDVEGLYDRTKINNLCLNREFDYDLNDWVKILYYIDNSQNILYKFNTDGEYLNAIKLSEGYDVSEGPKINNELTNYNTVATTYNYYRKYILPTLIDTNKRYIELDIFTIKNNIVTKHTLSSKGYNLLQKEWHHVAFTYSYSQGKIILYVDGNQLDSVTVDVNSEIYYQYKNNIGLGVSVLKFNTLQDDLKTSAYLFRGRMDDIRMYDRVLTPGNIGRLILNKYKIHDLVWNMFVGTKNYIEEIKQFYKHRPPGSKSALFDIYLTNTGITDPEIRTEIENIIKEALPRVAPSYTRLNKIVWT